MKKQNIKFLLALFISMLGTEASAHDVEGYADGQIIYYKYINNNTELEVTYRGSSFDDYSNEYTGNVVIPATVTYNGNTYSVTSIGDRAFYGCRGLTSIIIPNSVTSIGNWAFFYCSGLTSITIPNSVTSICGWAFCSCDGLTSVTIPSSVTSIGSSAFGACNSLKEVYFNATNCTSMGYDVFAKCSALTKLSIGDNVKNIPVSAFSGCSGLTSVTISNSVTSIGNYAFSDCTSLQTVTIGSGVLSVASNAFYGNKPKKVIWLTNTRSEGSEYVAGEVNYVTKSLGLSNEMIYPHLSSMFEVGGIKYVPVSWSERTCDAIDCTYDPTIDNIEIGEAVVYKGVQMNVNEIKPYTLCNNNYSSFAC